VVKVGRPDSRPYNGAHREHREQEVQKDDGRKSFTRDRYVERFSSS